LTVSATVSATAIPDVRRMNRAPTLLLSAVLVVATGTVPSIDTDSTMTPSSSPHLESETVARHLEPRVGHSTVTGGTTRQRELAWWAQERFESAGLVLPVLQFDLHVYTDACGGNGGLFSPSTDPWTITVCVEDSTTFLHEIGHAWAAFNLSEEQRDAYVSTRGMESWNAADTRWNRRGSEDAADTLAWGLREGHVDVDGIIPGGPLDQKTRAFRLLTGFEAPIVTG
jgi:hypothetical protein